MSDEDLLEAVSREIEWASEEHDDRIGQWEKAIAYFYGELPAAPEEDVPDHEYVGYSDIVSTDVGDAVEAVLAEIIPAYSGQSPVEFNPLGAEDEEQASIETEAVNHVANNCGSFMALNMAIKDALLRRAGVVKVYWEERAEVVYERHSSVPEHQLPQILQERPDESVEIVEGDLDPSTGTASGLLRRHKLTRRPKIDPVPLDEFLISANVSTPNLAEARFVAHQRPVTRSELIELGLDPETVKELDAYESADFSGAGSRARTSKDRELQTGHESTEYVMACESYYKIDYDMDGIAELRRVITAGGNDGCSELLLQEPWDEQPFCLGVPYLGIYSWDGVSLFDKLKMVQDIKTDMIRELRNATIRNMRQRVGVVENDANLDDAETSAMGGLVRCRTSGGMFALPDVVVPPQTYQFLEYMDKMRKDKGGGAIDTAAMANALAGDTAHGLERMMSAAEQINAMVAKNLCETLVKDMYRKLHKLLRQYMSGEIMLPGSAGWKATEPARWEPRQDMTVSMGMSVGERTRRTASLTDIQQQQAADAQTGKAGILSNDQGVYQTRIDKARMAGLPNPEQYFVDPASQEAQQVAQQMAQQAQQAQQQEQEMAKMQAEFQYKLLTDVEKIRSESKEAVEGMKATVNKSIAAMENATKMFANRIKLVEVEQEGDQAEAQQEIDRLQNG